MSQDSNIGVRDFILVLLKDSVCNGMRQEYPVEDENGFIRISCRVLSCPVPNGMMMSCPIPLIPLKALFL